MSGRFRYRRVYDEVSPSEGARVLVDRVWPRGVRKEALDLTEWLRDVAPSTELRQWYTHDAEKFDEFRRRYLAELKSSEQRSAVEHLHELADHGDVVLLTATRDVEHSQAAVLARWLNERHR
ncbi:MULTISPECIES: DUF488 domain-containing protein [Mycolicibacterium]|jgi:uncharacterized protein YeaO (DUF488 family)|uniref:DUF488 family protein n=1 Tax=Mycolicibacterium austroafricanum TaxID=39687 RepID=A0ABT8HPR1_MYCAO|nr:MULTISPECIES: DUF488 family protein [Mycolicibacterium]MDN4522747.1 DUF488 family protein [Mycolicibacterium austroafricanum]MDW5609388.1 DUF488 family protein [Mycolicibacterium sp. D5.8-2]PQP44326.1 DUF488 domain-containing protein [Mycolicibacterium austroafricanum]QRZ06905.1 DUF488 family protein [Mycolicibacterium austroafricanum]QZT56988.1 DUF488 family protein [Mycolicibacterium austroafricanum]